MLCLVTQFCLTLSDPMDCSPPSFSVHGENWSGLPCLPPRVFATQGSNPGLLHYRQILYCLSHQGSPYKLCVCVCVYIYIYTHTYIIMLWDLIFKNQHVLGERKVMQFVITMDKRPQAVVINFMGHLDSPRGAQIRYDLWVCLWECFWWRLASELLDSLK